MAARTNKKSLPQIAVQIRAIEKDQLIGGAIEIGRLLYEAEGLCDGESYVDWMDREFEFGHSTAANYRNSFMFVETHPRGRDYAKWNISCGAFYLLASTSTSTSTKAANLIIRAAQKGRMNKATALKIIKELPIDDPQDDDDDDVVDDDDDDSDDGSDGAAIASDPDDVAYLSGLLSHMQQHLKLRSANPAWREAFEAIGGGVGLQAMIDGLVAVFNKHCVTSAVQSAADRAAARSAKTAAARERESSDG